MERVSLGRREYRSGRSLTEPCVIGRHSGVNLLLWKKKSLVNEHNMAMEQIKNCCRTLTKSLGKDQEPPGIAFQIPVTKDYLQSKLPHDGREVPFVLPTLHATYVQPGANLRYGLPGPVRCTYAQRKTELQHDVGPFGYSSESDLLVGRRREGDIGRRKRSTDVPQELSTSMFELSSLDSPLMQSSESTSSMVSTPSSAVDSFQSSTECVPRTDGDVCRLCVRLSYQEETEQVWITLVQCSELKLPKGGTPRPKIRIRGIISIPKAVHFKSSVKEYCQHASFMETFVFALSLQTLRSSALVLRLQTCVLQKRTVAEGAISLRQLGPQETEHWLHLRAPRKSSVSGCELHVLTCFQPACRRMQVQVLAGQNLPPCLALLRPAFVVTAELQQVDGQVTRKKTRALKAAEGRCQWAETLHFPMAALDPACSLAIKLYCRSLNRNTCLGQVLLGLHSSTPEAVEQWKDTMEHPEKVVSAWHHVT
ncbi:tandem C2 domains nuclear protein isoform X2 [Entelurus aequoreus]|uniref:tandem C2 domains nuclear protein isoform X2 n=1 Tax=Entelurus aequoreus TaxID=161455 RepID=UPI002B1D2AF1|nr:tandem C2 domains nuclear protein isoform X2 [Entelurus aequoreus]